MATVHSAAAGAPNDPLAPLLGYQLRRASNALLGTLAPSLAEFGLSVGEASVLVVIAANDGVTQSSIGRMLDIHRANMVPIAAKLARMGLTVSERRGRELVLRTSAQGARTAQKILKRMHQHDRAHFAALDERQKKALSAVLRALWMDEAPPKRGAKGG